MEVRLHAQPNFGLGGFCILPQASSPSAGALCVTGVLGKAVMLENEKSWTCGRGSWDGGALT